MSAQNSPEQRRQRPRGIGFVIGVVIAAVIIAYLLFKGGAFSL